MSGWSYAIPLAAVERSLALVVDAFVGQQDVVVKPLGDYLGPHRIDPPLA